MRCVQPPPAQRPSRHGKLPCPSSPLQAAKGAKAYEKAEDPIYALRNNLPIDCQVRRG